VAIDGHADARSVLLVPTGPALATVVVYHGGGNDRWFGLGYVMETFLAAGFAVLTGNLPGHGVGGRDLFEVAAVRARVEALLGVARAVARVGTPVVVLGQSLGGSFALDQIARGVPADLVVTVSAPSSLRCRTSFSMELGCLRRGSVFRSLRYEGLLGALPAYRGFRRARFPVRTLPGCHYLEAFAEALDEMDLERRLVASPGPRPPVLLVHGERDGVVPVEQAHGLSRALGPRAQLNCVPGLHHLDPLLDRQVVHGLVPWILSALPPTSLR
jgi:alpha-beta hydrolase superfamily lysophospholipase